MTERSRTLAAVDLVAGAFLAAAARAEI